MTRDEAEVLILNAEGRLCVRFYKRADGSVITQDCPVGWAKVKQRTKIYAAAVASMVTALFTGILFVSFFSRSEVEVGVLQVPHTTPSPTPDRIMGAIAVKPPTYIDQGEMGGLSVEMGLPSNKAERRIKNPKRGR